MLCRGTLVIGRQGGRDVRRKCLVPPFVVHDTVRVFVEEFDDDYVSSAKWVLSYWFPGVLVHGASFQGQSSPPVKIVCSQAGLETAAATVKPVFQFDIYDEIDGEAVVTQQLLARPRTGDSVVDITVVGKR